MTTIERAVARRARVSRQFGNAEALTPSAREQLEQKMGVGSLREQIDGSDLART